MGRAGRIARGIMVLVSVLLVAACGDSFNDAYCEANNHRNQQTVEHLTNVLEQKRNQPGLYLARAAATIFSAPMRKPYKTRRKSFAVCPIKPMPI